MISAALCSHAVDELLDFAQIVRQGNAAHQIGVPSIAIGNQGELGLRNLAQDQTTDGADAFLDRFNFLANFKSNFLVACRGDEMTLPSAVELVGDDYITFNTDYPHPDGTWPAGFTALEQQPISDESKRKILWDNAASVFGLS